MSLVGFSSRSYRSSSRRPRFGGGARRASVIRTASSTSLPQWAIQQHQELLAARDKEAWAKLASGATDEFIEYAKERIAATTDEVTRKAWEGFLKTAEESRTKRLEVEATNKYITHLNDLAYEVQAGERSASDFVAYLQAERGKYATGDPKYSALTRALIDAKGWAEAMVRAQERRHEEEMAAMLANGEIKLEDALQYAEQRREGLEPGDEAYATLTQQIANLKNGIAARDFNAEIQEANAQLVAADNTPEAKKEYLGVLIGLTTRAKSAEAQKALATQITSVRTAIQKDESLADMREVNEKMTDYYSWSAGLGGKTTATEMIAFLTRKAAEASDPEDANRYTTLAANVVSRQHQLATRAGSGGGGGGGGGATGTTTWADRQLENFERDYKSALDAVNDAAKDGEVISPQDPRWTNYLRATSHYGLAISQLQKSGLLQSAAMQGLDTRKEAIGDDADGQVTLFGANALLELTDIKAKVTAAVSRMGANASDPGAVMTSPVLSLLERLNEVSSNPFLTTANQKRDALTARQTSQGALADLLMNLRTKAGGDTTPMANIEEKHAQYVDAYNRAQAKDPNKHPNPPKSLAEFMSEALRPDATEKTMREFLGIKVIEKTDLENLVKWDRQDDTIRVENAAASRKVVQGLVDEVKGNPRLSTVLRDVVQSNNLWDVPGVTDLTASVMPDKTGFIDETLKDIRGIGDVRIEPASKGPGMADIVDIFGGVDQMMFAPPLDEMAANNQRARMQPPGVVGLPEAGAGVPGGPMLTEFEEGGGPAPYEPPPDLDEFQNAQRMNQTPQDPFAAGWSYLITPVTFDVPAFELPPLPVEYDFIGPTFSSGYEEPSFDFPDFDEIFGYNPFSPTPSASEFDFNFDIPAFQEVNANITGVGGGQATDGGGGPNFTQ